MAKTTYRIVRNGEANGRHAIVEEKKKGWFRTITRRWVGVPSKDLSDVAGLDQWCDLETGEHYFISSPLMSKLTEFYQQQTGASHG